MTASHTTASNTTASQCSLTSALRACTSVADGSSQGRHDACSHEAAIWLEGGEPEPKSAFSLSPREDACCSVALLTCVQGKTASTDSGSVHTANTNRRDAQVELLHA